MKGRPQRSDLALYYEGRLLRAGASARFFGGGGGGLQWPFGSATQPEKALP